MKKLIALIIILFIVSFICGCTSPREEISEIEEDLAVSSIELEEENLPAGFPETVPLHNQASIKDSTHKAGESLESYSINMEFNGDIEQLSNWYKKELEADWQIGSISKGDFEDWLEFYIDAESNDYYLSVYLYQESGSNNVSIDINVGTKGKVALIDEEEPREERQVEAVTVLAISYSGELENIKTAFVCASIGSAWNINEHFPSLNIVAYDEYQFDKSSVIRDILAGDKPDIMIIKECAAYFPPEEMGSSMEAYIDLIRDWVGLCRREAVIPVLATIVPIDPDNTGNQEGQLESILEYNDWIHYYSRDENIPVLDLEAALRASDGNRVLNPKYDSGDGLHPNDLAYFEKLDYILIPALEEAFGTGY